MTLVAGSAVPKYSPRCCIIQINARSWDGYRHCAKYSQILLSNLTDLTQRAVVGSVALLGAPLFMVGYLAASLGMPAQTVNAEMAEAVATSSSPEIILCDELAVKDGERWTETSTGEPMRVGLS